MTERLMTFCCIYSVLE